MQPMQGNLYWSLGSYVPCSGLHHHQHRLLHQHHQHQPHHYWLQEHPPPHDIISERPLHQHLHPRGEGQGTIITLTTISIILIVIVVFLKNRRRPIWQSNQSFQWKVHRKVIPVGGQMPWFRHHQWTQCHHLLMTIALFYVHQNLLSNIALHQRNLPNCSWGRTIWFRELGCYPRSRI